MKKLKLHFPSLIGAMLYTLMAGHSAWADDTEVLIGTNGVPWAKPNVLFIMDSSGSMDTVDNIVLPDGTTDTRDRLQIVQEVFAALMTNNSGFNVALMRFDRNANGGYFLTPMQELNSTNRAGIIAASNGITHNGSTPLSETLYEAARYYGGLSVDYGDSSQPGQNHSDVFTGSTYDSPITSQCQKNFVILLTDGVPTSDTGADNNVKNDFLGGTACSGNGSGKCLDEIAGYLHTTDQSTGTGSIPGTQTVETYTIGFATNQALLQATATAGGGDYITASSAAQLTTAFDSILSTITDTNSAFSPPAMAANAFNSISNYDKMYFTLFEPAASPKWVGNVKPYTLNDDYQITDADDLVAIGSDGLFLDTSRSYWGSRDDGGSIAEGGANEQLPGAGALYLTAYTGTGRNLYTFTGSYDTAGAPDATSNATLSNVVNAFADSTTTGTNLTPALLELADATAADPVINAARNSLLNDPLHSKPALVTYGGTAALPDTTLFVATNSGFLHAINASTFGGRTDGEEKFAFMPQELLTNLSTLASTTGDHPYGLDGDVTTWVYDADNDVDLSDTGDHVFVYVGMRRGGNNYYALDVTDRNNPELKWVIKGGPGGTAGFSELGQSWSRPEVTTIKDDSVTGGIRTVLIFGGGYDEDQDDQQTDAGGNAIYGGADDIGRAIYIVDADDGERIWQVGQATSTVAAENPDLVISTMTNSIPSDIRLVDSDFDGHTDRLYVGDMNGQVFRIDLQATVANSTGIRLADLGGTIAADDRRFFYPPDIVVTQLAGNEPYVSVNMGSGYRAHPLNPLNSSGTAAPRVNDRFYSLRDPNVYTTPASFVAINHATIGDLLDATTTATLSTSEITTLKKSRGWFITLGGGNGEKVLAPSVTINGEIFFTTYTPPVSAEASSCAPPPGIGKLYRVSLFNATPPTNLTADGGTAGSTGGPGGPGGPGTTPPEPTVGDRNTGDPSTGIPSGPAVMFRKTDDGDVEIVLCVDTKCEKIPDSIQIEETYWID